MLPECKWRVKMVPPSEPITEVPIATVTPAGGGGEHVPELGATHTCQH